MKTTIIRIFVILLLAIIGASITACVNDKPTYYTVNYWTTGEGRIIGETEQQIVGGNDASEVTAVPAKGWMFIKWSDGVLDATRIDTNVNTFFNVIAIFEQVKYNVIYHAEYGGYIEGEECQSVGYGESASSVTAVANQDFQFIGWTDGHQDPNRLDQNIIFCLSVTANFERISGTYTYEYNNATGNNTEQSIFLKRGELQGIHLIVPVKEHFSFQGWFLDPGFQVCVADRYGKLLIGDEIFNNNDGILFARWEVVEKTVYKVLMVFDTAIKADLETADGEIVHVDYKMTDLERRICELIHVQFSNYLNDLFDGLVTFQVDSYFTTIPLTRENIYENDFYYEDGKYEKHYWVTAEDIQEVSGMLDNYRSVINTFCIDDYDYQFRTSSAMGSEKYAEIYFEGIKEYGNWDKLLDIKNPTWNSIIDTYAHEFIHTIEQGLAMYQYHYTMVDYHSESSPPLKIPNLYLFNKAIDRNGETAGIPLSYWKNEIFNVTYNATKGSGYVDAEWKNGWRGTNIQRVCKGSRANTVTAVPFPGYHFVGWSDGVTTATRTDYNIQSDFTVTALFEKNAYEVIYNAGDGGSIKGEAVQWVLYRERSKLVTAVADKGYRFIGWSDGVKEAERNDLIGLSQIDKKFEVTALFEKI